MSLCLRVHGHHVCLQPSWEAARFEKYQFQSPEASEHLITSTPSRRTGWGADSHLAWRVCVGGCLSWHLRVNASRSSGSKGRTLLVWDWRRKGDDDDESDRSVSETWIWYPSRESGGSKALLKELCDQPTKTQTACTNNGWFMISDQTGVILNGVCSELWTITNRRIIGCFVWESCWNASLGECIACLRTITTGFMATYQQN